MASALPTSTTSYLAKFGIDGSCLPSMLCSECGKDTGTDPDDPRDIEHAVCREARHTLGN
jgi:hypothetical protein